MCSDARIGETPEPMRTKFLRVVSFTGAGTENSLALATSAGDNMAILDTYISLQSNNNMQA